MELAKVASPMRFFMFFVGTIMWLGIWMTGFRQTYWLLYVTAVIFYFAALTGICPGMAISRMLFGKKD